MYILYLYIPLKFIFSVVVVVLYVHAVSSCCCSLFVVLVRSHSAWDSASFTVHDIQSTLPFSLHMSRSYWIQTPSTIMKPFRFSRARSRSWSDCYKITEGRLTLRR